MGLFGRLFGGGKGQQPQTEPRPAADFPLPDFTVDRSRMFDLSLTQRLQQIIAAPPASWDDASLAALYGAMWNASIALPSQDTFVGPDGLPYLRMDIPNIGPFDSQSLANIAGGCVEAGCGAALFASPDATEVSFVMPMGVLESLLTYGDWRGDPVDIAEQGDAPNGPITLEKGTRIMIAAPSATYLSPAAARALDHHLKERWSIEDPRVALMVSAEMQPTRSLVFSISRASFASDEEAEYFCRCLLWFLPPSRSVILLPDGWDPNELYPLSGFAQN